MHMIFIYRSLYQVWYSMLLLLRHETIMFSVGSMIAKRKWNGCVFANLKDLLSDRERKGRVLETHYYCRWNVGLSFWSWVKNTFKSVETQHFLPPKKARLIRNPNNHLFIVFVDMEGALLWHVVPEGMGIS